MTQEELIALRTKIEEERKQSLIEVWCRGHGFNPELVTYKDGMLCIPFKL